MWKRGLIMLGIWSNLVLDWGFIHNLVLPPVNSQLGPFG